jgi:hypothetical protein
LTLPFFVAVPITLAALVITPLPPLPLPFTITLFVAHHLAASAFVRIFAIAIARCQQQGQWQQQQWWWGEIQQTTKKGTTKQQLGQKQQP